MFFSLPNVTVRLGPGKAIEPREHAVFNLSAAKSRAISTTHLLFVGKFPIARLDSDAAA
jgi:hypothetical protein